MSKSKTDKKGTFRHHLAGIPFIFAGKATTFKITTERYLKILAFLDEHFIYVGARKQWFAKQMTDADCHKTGLVASVVARVVERVNFSKKRGGVITYLEIYPDKAQEPPQEKRDDV
jgi:hypothetical protein